jgi:serine/threonine-protein kinase
MIEGKEKPAPSPWLALIQLLVTLGIIVGLSYGFTLILQRSAPGEAVVPKVEGLDQAAAEILLRHSGLEVSIEGQRPSDSVEEGKVIEANPPAGNKVKQGRIVRLLVSQGSVWTNVPDIREMSERRARSVLQEKSLFLGQVRRVFHTALPEGFVIAQLPAPGTRVSENSEVQAVISKGPRPGTPSGTSSGQTEEKPASTPGTLESPENPENPAGTPTE